MEELETLTIKELQTKLIESGMPEEDAVSFKTKASAIATLRTMAAKEAVLVDPIEVAETKKVASIQEKPNPSEDRLVNKNWKNKAERMKANLLAQERVSILIPTDPQDRQGVVTWKNERGGVIDDATFFALPLEEKMRCYQVHVSGSIESVQLNGYKYFIPKGVYTPVPRQIAEVISRSQQQTLDAGKEYLVDRIDPKTGRPMSDVL